MRIALFQTMIRETHSTMTLTVAAVMVVFTVRLVHRMSCMTSGVA